MSIIDDHLREEAVKTGIALPQHVVDQMSWHARSMYYRRLRLWMKGDRVETDDVDLRVLEDPREPWWDYTVQEDWIRYEALNHRANTTYSRRMTSLAML